MFAADKTANLIVRLQYNVIRAGLRRINLAYSRISLADVASRLGALLSCLVVSHTKRPKPRWWCPQLSSTADFLQLHVGICCPQHPS